MKLARDYQQRLSEMSKLVKEAKHEVWQNWHELSIKLENLRGKHGNRNGYDKAAIRANRA